MCKIGGLQRHLLAHNHRHDVLTDTFDPGGCVLKGLAIRGIDCNGQVVITKGDAPGFLIVSGKAQFFAQRNGGIIGGVHLPDDALNAFCHDVGRDRAEGIGQNDVQWQVERVQQGDIGEGRIGFDAEEGTIPGVSGCCTGDANQIIVKGGPTIRKPVGEGQGALTKTDAGKTPEVRVLR